MAGETLRLLLVDDEPLARTLARRYAAAIAGVEIAGECGSADELPDALVNARPDVMLLDIRMPGSDVFTVLESLARARRLPGVIFATAHDAYAARAFEMNAVDYLVKPYTADRMAEALNRARSRHATDAAAGLSRVIRDLGPRPDRLLVPDGRRMIPLAIADIVWIKAEDDYARVHALGRTFLIGRTLKELERRLDPDRFVRIHRSAIVQTSHVREVIAEGGSRYRVRLSDGTDVIVSRARAGELRKLKL
jgi:two-component system LytT family response regulator